MDGYAMPLTCRGGLMYLSILGELTDQELESYPAVHLTGPHEWDPSVLDYTHPSGDGEPHWSNDHDERSAFDPNFDNNREISMIFPLVSCCSCVNNPSSSQKRLNCLYLALEVIT